MDERGPEGNGWLFDNFIRDLLKASSAISGLEAERDGNESADIGVDFVAWYEGRPLLVEAQFQTPQTTSRLLAVIEKLKQASVAYQQARQLDRPPRLVIAFPGVLSEQRRAVVQGADVQIWDGIELQRMARLYNVFAPMFLAIPEGEEPPIRRRPADELLARLTGIRRGKRDWQAFEQFIEDLLNLLFVPPLNPVVTQSSTENGVNRRDFILPNYAPADSFWGFARIHYRGDFIVADAKNYRAQIGKAEVLQIANYLSHHGTGLVGLLLTRTGMASSARWTSREQWLLYNKLIVGLSDDDYRQMLLTHRAGGDPADLVRQRIEDFRLGM
ncbi:hypothetical protein [Actinoplanes sp. L3-i22]|uniref:hypothetical protein n=1 Tax=Actinoplanes sp. L3-i22 TaxID=2836373 RepID=UPI001C76C27F|nr:hypothetical protein [Actinoplanes sp. L3-i22]BCY08732.1 hypothetical protein L3i22_038200 [Actinoplanes sp. L3-i22]